MTAAEWPSAPAAAGLSGAGHSGTVAAQLIVLAKAPVPAER